MTRKSPERFPVPLDHTARFDAGYTLNVGWHYPAWSDSFGGWFFFNIRRIQVLVSDGRVICQDVGWTFFEWDTFAEDGRFVVTAEEIGQLMGGN